MITDALQRLREYVRHRPDCAAWTNESHPAEWRERDAEICTCGLSGVLATVREIPQEWTCPNCYWPTFERPKAEGHDAK